MIVYSSILMINLLLQTSPLTFRLRVTSTMVLHATHTVIVSVNAVVGVQLLATTLADKYMATVRSKIVLVKLWQRLEQFVTDITGVNPLFFLCFVPPTLIPPSYNMISLTNLPSIPAGLVASR